jgi:hypothetical protein
MSQENNELENSMFSFYQQKTLLAAVHGTYFNTFHFRGIEMKINY